MIVTHILSYKTPYEDVILHYNFRICNDYKEVLDFIFDTNEQLYSLFDTNYEEKWIININKRKKIIIE